MAQYDLTSKISEYLDRHLIFPFLEFITARNIYKLEDMLRTKLALLDKTSMADFSMEVYEALYGTKAPQQYIDKKERVLEKFKSSYAAVRPIMDIFSANVMESINNHQQSLSVERLREELETKHGFHMDMLDALYSYSRVVYDCGHYGYASSSLKIVKLLGGGGGVGNTSDDMSTFVVDQQQRFLNASWGKLACEILNQNWNEALDDLQKLREVLDAMHANSNGLAAAQNTHSSSHLMQLQQRTWLLHWSLFVFFNHPKGKELLIDWFLYTPLNLNAIQTLAPHLLRYLSACVVINAKRRRSAIKDLVKVIQQETYQYRDPMIDLIESVYINFDFDKAQHTLKICENVLKNDFFLTACDQNFMDMARHLIFETFCRLHHTISIDMLADKLSMEVEEAENWIVQLMQFAKMDAKIDSKNKMVLMGSQMISPYQQIIDKTRSIVLSTPRVLSLLEKKHGIRSDLF